MNDEMSYEHSGHFFLNHSLSLVGYVYSCFVWNARMIDEQGGISCALILRSHLYVAEIITWKNTHALLSNGTISYQL